MPANNLKSTDYILDEWLVRFVNYLNFAKVAYRKLEDDFKDLRFATGQTLNYRKEERYLSKRGATASPQARIQTINPLTIDTQFHTMVSFSGMELTFDRVTDAPYLDEMLNPRAKTMANDVEKFIATEHLQKKVGQATGTPGVPIDFRTVADTDAYMSALAIPEDGDRYFANDPFVSAALSDNLKNVFNMTVNRGALLDGFIGHLSGFDFFKTNFLQRQIAGAGEAGGSPPTGFKLGGIVVNPVSSGDTLELSGLVANEIVFREGDSIEIDDAAGVFMVNPLIQDSHLQQRAQFSVAADVTSDGAGFATVPVVTEIIVSGARRNISATIPAGAQVLLAKDHNVSIAFHKQAIVFAAPAIKELVGGVEATTSYSEKYKMAITHTLGADIYNYKQLDRLDMLGGVAINPEFAVRVRS